MRPVVLVASALSSAASSGPRRCDHWCSPSAVQCCSPPLGSFSITPPLLLAASSATADE